MKQPKQERRPEPDPWMDAGPSFRSAAVARMAQMPVATLRIWEQRHQAVRPATAPSGHRLYSPADVQRLLLLRQLTEQGHAIGSIAGLDTVQLQTMGGAVQGLQRRPGRGQGGVDSGVGTRAGAALPASPPRRATTFAVVGPALAARLRRPQVARQLGQLQPQLSVFTSLAEAAQDVAMAPVDVLVWHAPELWPPATVKQRDELLAALDDARRARGARQVAVLYRFAGSIALQVLATAGVVTQREPADDESLGRWLADLTAALPPRPGEDASPGANDWPANEAPASGVLPRRFEDAQLTAIAGLQPTLACECPRHVAELLMQLASFEAYSADCVNRDPADAALHAYLQQVAGASRAMFETALERLAWHEGLPLK